MKKYFYIRIPGDTNLYFAELGDFPFKHGEKVIIKTEFGEDMGYITSFPFAEKPDQKGVVSAGRMLRYATDEDQKLITERFAESRQTRLVIQNLAQDLNLEMNITHILLPLKGKTLVVYYTANAQVDFRELLKRLRNEFKSKIIMRQIHPRQREESFHLHL